MKTRAGCKTPFATHPKSPVRRENEAGAGYALSPSFRGEGYPTFTPVIEIAAQTSSLKKLTGSPRSWAPST